jgi:hypothetical protein
MDLFECQAAFEDSFIVAASETVYPEDGSKTGDLTEKIGLR